MSILLPRLRPLEFVQAYKQARRRDDDIAIVNACFRVHFVQAAEVGHILCWIVLFSVLCQCQCVYVCVSQGAPTVAHASFAYGGLGPVTLSAPKAEAVLLGRTWDESTLDAVVAALQQDFVLPPDAVGGMAQYRQTLTASLFMKFFLTVKQQLGGHVAASQARAIEKRHRPCSQSVQLFEVTVVWRPVFGGRFPVLALYCNNTTCDSPSRRRWWARVATILLARP